MLSNCMQYCVFEILKARILSPELELWCILRSHLVIWFLAVVVASAVLRERIVIIVEVDGLGGSCGAMSVSWCLTKASKNERFSLKSQAIVNLKTMAYLYSRQLFSLEFCSADHSISLLSLFFTFETYVVNQVH